MSSSDDQVDVGWDKNVVPPVEVKVSKAAEKNKIPPMVSFQLTNPVVYIRAWWKKLIGNEGIKLTLQIKPVTAIVLVVLFSGVGFGAGRLSLPEPIEKYILINPDPTPEPTPDPWKEAAFSGKVQLTGNTYYLVTTSAQAIQLQMPDSINLKPLVGKRLLVAGRYNKDSRIMVVTSTTDLEILPAAPVPVPTVVPTASDSAKQNF